jgi:hypothetical protein
MPKTKEEVYSTRVFRLNYGDGALVLSLYPNPLGNIFAAPRGTETLSHITYLKSAARVNTNRGSIDQFLIKDSDSIRLGFNPEFIDITSPELLPGERNIEETYGVHYQFLRESMKYKEIVRRVAIRDIFKFHVGKKPPVISIPFSTELLEKFTGLAPRLGGYARIDGKFGKQAFEQECLADLNLDFARWCVTGITPDFLLKPEQKCLICYNGYKHIGYPAVFKATREHLVKQIRELRKERAERVIIDPKTGENIHSPLPTRYLRLAKGTEVGHPLFRKQLKAALEACIDEGLIAFMPQKFLEPDEEVARLFRENKSVLLISIDNDSLDPGACYYGRTNEARFRDGLWYLDKEVNVVPYVNVVLTQEMGGPLYKDNLERALRDFPRTQLLPVRIRKKEHAHIIGGWNTLVGQRQTNVFGEECGGCDVTKDHQRLFNYVHPSIESLIGDNNQDVRMCHHCHSKGWCGKCFLPGERGVIFDRTPPKIIKDKDNERPRRKKIDMGEETLFKWGKENPKKDF